MPKGRVQTPTHDDPETKGVSQRASDLIERYRRMSGRECIREYLADNRPCSPVPDRLMRRVMEGA